MKPSLLLALALSFAATCATASPGDTQDDPAARIKTAITRDWSARTDPDSGNVVVSSPIYPMQFDQGCVIHELAFLSGSQGPSLASMVAEDRYFAFASGQACAGLDPAQFFWIHAGSDVFGVLDFARRLKAGPQAGRDTLSKDAQSRVPACFLPDAMRSTRITRASSRRVGGTRGEEYKVVLACDGLRDGEEIYATGSRKDHAAHWEIGSLTMVDTVKGG